MKPVTLRRLPRRGERRLDILPWLWRMRWFGAAVLAAALVFYAILWAMFARAGRHAGDYLEQVLNGRVQVARVHVSRGFRVDLYGIKVFEPGRARGGALVLEARRVSLWPEWTGLLSGNINPRRIAVWNPRLQVRRAPGGQFTVDDWVRRAMGPRKKQAARAFPALVEIHGGTILVQLTAGSRKHHAFLLVENIEGKAGRTRGSLVAVDMAAAVFGAAFTVQGAVAPGDEDMFRLKIKAPFFAFSDLFDLVNRAAPGSLNQAGAVPLGTGRFEATLHGTPAAPRANGSAALRDFDTQFTYENNTLRLTRIRAGAGPQQITGDAFADFADPALPFTLELDFRNLDLGAMLSPAMGFQYAPEGMLNGVVRVRGKLSRTGTTVGGSLEVRDGTLHFPMLRAGPGPSPFSNTAALPFTRLSADFTAGEDSLKLENLRVAGAGYTITGNADLGAAPADLQGFDAAFPYSMDLAVAAPSLEEALANIPAWQGLANGALDARIHMQGNLAVAGSAAGDARITVRNGELVNPYFTTGNAWYGGARTIPFNRLNARVRVQSRMLHVSGALAGDGLDLSWDGRVNPDTGSVNLTGRAAASTDSARWFQGLAPYVQLEPPDTFTDYKSEVRITGTLTDPVTSWARPRATRWHTDENAPEE